MKCHQTTTRLTAINSNPEVVPLKKLMNANSSDFPQTFFQKQRLVEVIDNSMKIQSL